MTDIQDSQLGPRDRQPSEIVAFEEDTSRQISASESEPTSHRWLSAFNRRTTYANVEPPAQSRAFYHAYLIKRPRALQFYNPDIIGARESVEERLTDYGRGTLERERSGTSTTDSEKEERSTDNAVKQYERVDLFIDLIWVGIIANLSATFGEQAFGGESGLSIGEAIGEFVLLFVPIWRVWDHLREYISNFYKDDLTDRNFIIWILLLSVLWGVNAPFAFVPDGEGNSLTLLIAIYLITRLSFLAINGLQSIFIPFIRRQVAFQALTSVLVGALWIAAIYVPYPSKFALLVLANAIEQPINMIIVSPIGDKLITGGWKRKANVDRYIERHESFFTIILGEGVFRLIEGSPSGLGLNSHSGTILVALLMYYILHWLYFNGDQSQSFVHAMRRTWWKPFLWKFFHIVMFAALLILAASVVFLAKNEGTTTPHLQTETTTDSGVEAEDFVLKATWTASTSLAMVLFSMTSIALLNRSLDKPNTLVINSRWIRLAPRLPAMVVNLCLPLVHGLSGGEWCGASCILIYVVFFWELVAGLESKWKFLEPKPVA